MPQPLRGESEFLSSDVSTKADSSKLYVGQGVRRFKPPPFYHSSAKRIRDYIALRIYLILLESTLKRLPAPVQIKTCQHPCGSFEHPGVGEKIKPDVR